VLAMIQKEFRELRRDRRTLAMLIVFPLLLLIIFGYAASFDVDSIPTAVVGPNADLVSEAVSSQQVSDLFDIVILDPSGTSETAQDLLRDRKAQVAIATDTQPATAYIDGTSLFSANAASAALGRLGDQVNVEILYNPDLVTSWVVIPPLIGYILMFIGTVVASIGLVKERENGTLEQLAVMPLSPGAVIFGKIAPYFLVAAVDLVILTVLAMILFNIPFVGSVLLFAAGGVIFLFVVLGVGVLISTVSQTTGQAIQLAIFFLVPQILLSGMIFPLSAMPGAIRWLAYVFPLTYYTVMTQGIQLRGAGIDSLWPQFLVLTAMAVVVFTAAVLRFRSDLTPHRSDARDIDGAET
jgi:ABC-2 type transport system permease protein